MLLSPTVKVGSDHCSRTVAPLFPHCYNYHLFYVFTLSPTLTPVGDPLRYKRRPMQNCLPRTPMGPEPLACVVRGRREHKEQIVEITQAVYPGSGRDGRVKPYSCLIVYCVGELGSLKNQLHRAYERSRFRTPSTLCMGLLL